MMVVALEETEGCMLRKNSAARTHCLDGALDGFMGDEEGSTLEVVKAERTCSVLGVSGCLY